MIILADTSVWIDHLRASDKVLSGLLDAGKVVAHPFVVGEIALGHLAPRDVILQELSSLPVANVADDSEVMDFIENNRLSGIGIGYVDAHLLAAIRLTPGTALWTRDKRLHAVARKMRLAAP